MTAQFDGHLAGLRATFVPRVARTAAPFEAYRDRPVEFFSEVLGVEPWGRHEGLPASQASQVDLLETVRDHKLVAIRSGHKISKSLSAAGLGLWWVLTRVGGHVVLSAPSYDQVKDPIWAEIRSLVSGVHASQRRAKEEGKHLPSLPGHCNLEPHSGYQLGPNWGIWGKSTDRPERMAGPSGADIMYLIDEASGYVEEILTAIMGGLAGGGKLVLFGNPTQTSGVFYSAFHEQRGAWKCLHTASTSTPNFHGRRIPGLADPEWLETVAKPMWGGPGSPNYDVRVEGEFPGQAVNAIVGLRLLEVARARYEATPAKGRLEIGLDVAREPDGDETIACPRRGNKVFPLVAVPLDPVLAVSGDRETGSPPIPLGHQAALGAVRVAREEMQRWKDAGQKEFDRPRIKVDAIGNGTAALDYLLAHHSQEFEIIGVVVSKAADETLELAPGKTAYDEYVNLRAQIVFGVARFLAEGGALPPDEKLGAELVAPIYKIGSRGRLQAESKEELKKRLKRSPDRADACALSCYEPPVVFRGVTEQGVGWGSMGAPRASVGW